MLGKMFGQAAVISKIAIANSSAATLHADMLLISCLMLSIQKHHLCRSTPVEAHHPVDSPSLPETVIDVVARKASGKSRPESNAEGLKKQQQQQVPLAMQACETSMPYINLLAWWGHFCVMADPLPAILT